MSKIKIILNGEEFFCEKSTSLLDLIQNLNLDIGKIAIEKNHQIITQEGLEEEFLKENDKIEIVNFIGGG